MRQPQLKTLLACIRDRRGETIAEVLVAMTIAGLALLMLAMVIATSSSIITKSRDNMADYYKTANQIAAYQAGGTVTEVTGGSVHITSTGGTAVKLSPAQTTTDIAIDAYVSDDEENPVVAYEEASS